MAADTEAILRPFLIAGPRENGDWDARCPLHDDNRRSATINFKKGVWKCFATCGGGGIRDLIKRMEEEGRLPDPEKDPPRPSRSKRSITLEKVDRWHQDLLEDEARLLYLWSERAIQQSTVKRFRLGWDANQEAFCIPIFDETGALFNVRKYRPNAPSDRKIWWHIPLNGSRVPIYPIHVLRSSDWVLLCEGEMDALVAMQHGFPAVTGTAGAGTWHVEWSEQFRDKQVFIVYDRDATGERGARAVAEALEPYARIVRVAEIPLKKAGADVSDFFGSGGTAEDFKRVLRRSRIFEKRSSDPMDMDPRSVSVIHSFSALNIGKRMQMDVHISGRHNPPYDVPRIVRSECTMDAGAKCKVCPMLALKGTNTYEIPPWAPAILQMAGSPDNQQAEVLRRHIRAVKCDRLRHEVLSFQSVEELYVQPSWDSDEQDFTNRKILSVGRHDTLPSQTVKIEGTSWPDPRDQRNSFLAWGVQASESSLDEFRVSPELVRRLLQFRAEEEGPLRKLWEVAGDLERHVTRIYGRRDLHMLITLVACSVLSFSFRGRFEPRGWLDALVIGDTRTGKSEAATRLMDYMRLGRVVNCEAATFAGVVAALKQQGGGREWTIQWGVVPMSDRRMVVLDEASGLSPEDIAKMSDIRSSGVATITKVQQERAKARTRLLWLSNPRDDSMNHFTYGVQAITPLIGNPEDIARFDIAMALTSDEVSIGQIHGRASTRDPAYSGEDLHQLVLWAWSRKPEDVVWAEGAEDDVMTSARWLSGVYIPNPPLIQTANINLKVARISAALAAATFSTDNGRRLIIEKRHVQDALRFIHYLYSKESFGYWQLSQQHRASSERAVASMDEVKRLLQERPPLARFLTMVGGQFQRDMLEQMLNISREEANGIINMFYGYGMLVPNTRAVKLQPALHQLLRELDERRGSNA